MGVILRLFACALLFCAVAAWQPPPDHVFDHQALHDAFAKNFKPSAAAALLKPEAAAAASLTDEAEGALGSLSALESRMRNVSAVEGQLLEVGQRLSQMSAAAEERLRSATAQIVDARQQLSASETRESRLKADLQAKDQEIVQMRKQLAAAMAQGKEGQAQAARAVQKQAEEEQHHLDEEKKLKEQAAALMKHQVEQDEAEARLLVERMAAEYHTKELLLHDRSNHLSEEEKEWAARKEREEKELVGKREHIMQEVSEELASNKKALQLQAERSISEVRKKALDEEREIEAEEEQKVEKLKKQFEEEKASIIYNRHRKFMQHHQ